MVIDVKTGDVLALASYPNFDPNNPGSRTNEGARNRAVTDTYEVGSVMKIFTIATALELGVIKAATLIDTEKGRFRLGRKVFRDSFHDEELDVGGIIKRSSNVGAVKIALMLGADALHSSFLRLGFGQPTEIELPGEQAGVVRDPKTWGQLGLATHSFGYGMTSTPLQVTAAMAAVATGVLHQPRIIRSIVDDDGRVLYERTPEGQEVITEETVELMRPMMESVFEHGKVHGTARGLFVPGYRVAGKTGTAHKYDRELRAYGDQYLSSFSGYAPLEDPRIAVTVLIDEPHGEEHYGGKVAGPAWTRIVTETLPLLGAEADPERLELQLAEKRKWDRRFAWRQGLDWDKIQRMREKEAVPLSNEEDFEELGEEQEEEVLALGDVDESTSLREGAPGVVRIPDFTGLGLARAIAVARGAAIDIEVAGQGRAIDQSPAPGLSDGPGKVRVIFTSNDHAFDGG